jgi:uncharacterized membrane protein YeaQ/YmgE (transglycosylase-associated protein family)
MTGEYLARVGPMVVLGGLSVAWLAQISGRTRAYGFLPDIAFGLIGSLTAGLLAWATLASGTGMLTTFGIGALGAVLALAVQRGVWRPVPIRS